MASVKSSTSLIKPTLERRQSYDTLCSSNSSCYRQKRRPVHPLAVLLPKNNASTVKQRVLSARLLKLRSLQSQLSDANFHLSELQQENKLLKTLQVRSDRALARYEGKNADLPKLLQSHENEILTLQTKNKNFRKSLAELTSQLKVRDEELVYARDHIKELTTLVRNRGLGERQALSNEVQDLRTSLKKCEAQVDLLNRKLELESKSFKHKLAAEMAKHKRTQMELATAITEIDRLTGILEDKEDQASVYGHRNFTKLIHREPIIASTKLPPKRLSKPQKDDPETPSNKLRQASNESLSTDILIPPSESVKARLSSAKNVKITLSTNDLNEYPAEADEIYPKELRPLSSYKLEKLSDHLKCSVKKAAEDTNSCTLNDYCSDVMSSIKSSAFETDKHKEDYRNSKEEYEQLVKEIEDTDEMQKKLTQADFLRDIEIPEKELDLVNKIWKEEVVFQAQQNKRIGQNGDKRLETKEEKEKLLAALRAIDKGEDVAYHENCEKRNGRVEKSSGKNKLMNELFGDDIEN